MAEEHVGVTLKLRPTSSEALYLKAKVLFKQKKFQECIESLDKSIEHMDPFTDTHLKAPAFFLTGQAYHQLNDLR